MNKQKLDIANLKVSRRVCCPILYIEQVENEENVTDETPFERPPKPRLVSNSIIIWVSRKYNTCILVKWIVEPRLVLLGKCFRLIVIKHALGFLISIMSAYPLLAAIFQLHRDVLFYWKPA
jgi:hypothetical protein